mgnify:CR=1 FL=1
MGTGQNRSLAISTVVFIRNAGNSGGVLYGDWEESEGTFNLACDPQRASGMMQNTCVKIEHVTKRFGEDIVLQEVNLSLKTGNVYGIVGNNGSGKTVLMKCICGFLPVTTGTIFVLEKK